MNMNNIFRKALNEAFFGKKDIDDHGFNYLRRVLDNLENNNTISLKTKGSTKGVETDITHLKNEEFNNNIQNFKKWLNGDGSLGNVKTLNDYKNMESVESARLSLLQQFFNSFNLNFTDIEKTDYSIIRTPEQESIQAIFLAAKILGDDCFKDINILYKNEKKLNDKEINARENIENLFYKNELGITLANRRLVFSKEENKKVLKKLANILKINLPDEISELKDRGFTIIHPDGLVNEYKNENENVEFAKVLFGKGVQFIKDKGQKRSLSKDSFIPADIYIIPLDTIDILRDIVVNEGKVFSPKSIVSLSNRLFKYKIGKDIVPLIYPISLKMKDGIPEFHRLDNSTAKTENLIQVGIDNIKENGIYFNQMGNSTMEIEYGNDTTLVFEFRTKKTSAKWQCNAKNKANRNAIEGGSAKEYMKIVFDDEMNDCINDDGDDGDVNKIVEVFGNRIRINKELNMRESFIKNKSAILEESFRKFFEDESTSKITTRDMVLLAVPGSVVHNNITSPSAKEGCIGLGWFCKKLIDNDIKGSGNYNEKLSEIVQKSFKMNDFVQDTWKIM